jgi:protein import protein ZIM17
MQTAARMALRRSLFLGIQRISRNRIQPQLPFWRVVSKNYCENQQKQALGEIEKKKFYLQFTCKKCSTRSSHFISKLAYEKGVVIVECPGCKNNHLIADNLKWFRDQNTNVEDLLRENGEVLQKTGVIELLGDDDNERVPTNKS